jgi:uracil-DNA glycosylase family 4
MTPLEVSDYLAQVEADPDSWGRLPELTTPLHPIPGADFLKYAQLHLGDAPQVARPVKRHCLKHVLEKMGLLERVEITRLSKEKAKEYCEDVFAARGGIIPAGHDPTWYFKDARRLAKPVWGDGLKFLLHRCLYSAEFSMPFDVSNVTIDPIFVPGHTWGLQPGQSNDPFVGPFPADIMMIGKWPGYEEELSRRTLVGKAGRTLLSVLEDVGIDPEIYQNWYATNVVRFKKPDTLDDGCYKTLAKRLAHLVDMEIRLVKPNLIICLGGEPASTILNLKANVKESRGVVYKYPLHESFDPIQGWKVREVPLVVVPNPVLYDKSKRPLLSAGLRQAWSLHTGEYVPETVDSHVKVNLIHHTETLRRLVDERIAFRQRQAPTGATGYFQDVICLDCEWHGEPPKEPGSYLRSVQFCWDDETAHVLVLTKAGGARNAMPDLDSMLKELARLFEHGPTWKVRVGGHAFKEDLQALRRHGCDLTEAFRPSQTVEGTRDEGGWDTLPAFHAIHSDGPQSLKDLATLYLDCPRWDLELVEFLKAWCKEHKVPVKSIAGYGDVSEEIMYGSPGKPGYAALDVIRNIRLFWLANGHDGQIGALDRGPIGPSSRAGYHLGLLKQLAVAEMEETGFVLDWERFDKCREQFNAGLDKQLSRLREMTGLPKLRPTSEELVELLFGQQYVRKVDKAGNKRYRLPVGYKSLGLTPLHTSGQKQARKKWDKVVAQRKEHLYTPTADTKTIETIYYDEALPDETKKILQAVMNVSKLKRAVQDKLCPPLKDKKTESIQFHPDGRMKYKGGFGKFADADSIIRSYYRLIETWRGSSRSPNLQNLSHKADKNYIDALENKWMVPIRSCLKSPDNYMLVSADYSGAETYGIGIMALDWKLIKLIEEGTDMHCWTCTNLYPECRDLPEDKRFSKKFYESDPHLKRLRDLAKIPSFMIPYGGGAEALQSTAWQYGIPIDLAEAQRIREMWLGSFPDCDRELKLSFAAAHDPGWIAGFGGCIRRAPQGLEPEDLHEYGRQFMNYRIQNLVAVCVIRSLNNMLNYREYTLRDPDAFRICIEVHDAVMAWVRVDYVREFVEEVVPLCMTDMVPIRPVDHFGKTKEVDRDFFLKADCSVYKNWGVPLTRGQCEEFAFPLRKPYFDGNVIGPESLLVT